MGTGNIFNNNIASLPLTLTPTVIICHQHGYLQVTKHNHMFRFTTPKEPELLLVLMPVLPCITNLNEHIDGLV